MRYFFLLGFLALLCCCRQADDGRGDELTITTYNVENLCDGAVQGGEYAEYLPSGGWTDEAYRARLARIRDVLKELDSAVYLLEEVEHPGVVEDLAEGALRKAGYRWVAQVKNEGEATGVALLSRIRPDWVRGHRVEGCRPLLEASFFGGSLFVIALHAKSRIGGEDTERRRIDLVRLAKEVAAGHEGALVVLAGDFNEEPDAWRASDRQTAFVGLGTGPSALWSRDGSLVVSGMREEQGRGVWYNPWLDPAEREGRGSCAYDGAWKRYDQILASSEAFDGREWEYAGFRVAYLPSLLAASGFPLSWDRKAQSGVSDHLPVTMVLRDAGT